MLPFSPKKKLIDFINPKLEPSLSDSTLNPLISIDGNDSLLEKNSYGFPIYSWESNLTSKTRYIGNENLNLSCLDYVNSKGGKAFFDNPNWRRLLKFHFEKMEKKFGEGTFQSFERRKSDIKEDLSRSKSIIENKLNKSVRHLCLPWYKGNQLTLELSKETGYSGIYWGIVNMHAINRLGNDPLFIYRINDYYIYSLPGKNRMTFGKQIRNKLKKRY